MRISLPPVLLTASLVLAAPIHTDAQEVRGIVFAASGAPGDTAWIEPVALLRADGYDEPDAAEAGPFTEQWMRTGRRYTLLSRGEQVGSVTVDGTAEEGCVGISAFGRQAGRAPLRDGEQGLAGEGIPAQRGAPWLRSVTAAERGELDRMAAALFDAHGIDLARRPRGDTGTAALLVGPGARPLLVGTYARGSMDAGLERKSALMVIAEDGGRGYRPAYVWFHEALESHVESRELVDAADLDGDGSPELVVRTTYYESWNFTILSRTEHGWLEVYRGGGSGC